MNNDIKNIFDFDAKVEYILNEKYADITKETIKQTQYMNSKNINENFESIEISINVLYEKTRLIDEIMEYAKIYVENNITESISECKAILNEIEKMNDINFSETKNFRIITVPMVNNEIAQYLDRDGSQIKMCEVYNGVISLSGNIKNSILIASYTVSSSEQVYERNNPDFNNKEAYRTNFLLDGSVKGGVFETITFNFDKTVDINSMKVKLSNCNAYNIVYVFEDNTEMYDTYLTGIIPEKSVASIKLIINCGNYVIQKVDSVIRDNAFDLLDDYVDTDSDQIVNKEDKDLSINYNKELADYINQLIKEGVNNDRYNDRFSEF